MISALDASEASVPYRDSKLTKCDDGGGDGCDDGGGNDDGGDDDDDHHHHNIRSYHTHAFNMLLMDSLGGSSLALMIACCR